VSLLSRIPLLALILVLLAAVQQTFVAVGVLKVGRTSGTDAPLTGLLSIAILALLVVGVALVAAAGRVAPLDGALTIVLLIPAAGLLAVVHFYSYDPYYLPTLRRFADYRSGGEWIAIVTGASVLFALAGRFGARAGVRVVGAGAWIAAVAIALEGFGH
jgi:hypothetical protein